MSASMISNTDPAALRRRLLLGLSKVEELLPDLIQESDLHPLGKMAAIRFLPGAIANLRSRLEEIPAETLRSSHNFIVRTLSAAGNAGVSDADFFAGVSADVEAFPASAAEQDPAELAA